MDSSNRTDHPFTRFLQFFITGLVLLSLLVLANRDWEYPLSGHPTFERGVRRNYLNDMNNLRPELVLLGDSTLNWGVDDKVVSAATGMKLHKIGIQGSASALWYLLIKNSIAQADFKPEVVAIFFRDTMLTDPAYRVYGEYFLKIDEYGNDADETLISKAYNIPRSLPDRFLMRFLPVYAERSTIQGWINGWLQPLLTQPVNGCDYVCVEYAKARVFNFVRLNPAVYSRDVISTESQLYTADKLLFDQQFKDSFLPDIIRLCKRNGIKLVLVRLGTNRFSSRADEPFLLRRYLVRLEETVKAAGVAYMDWDYENGISASDFRDSVHMNAGGREIFTKVFVKDLIALLETK